MIGPNAARLHLHEPWDHKHSVFPVSLLKLHKSAQTDLFPNRREPPPPTPEFVDEEGSAHWEIEKIIKQHCSHGEKGYRYLVRWKGFDSTMDTWELEENLAGTAADALRDFRASQRAEKRTLRSNS